LSLKELGIQDGSQIVLHSEKTLKELGDAVQPFRSNIKQKASVERPAVASVIKGSAGNDNNNVTSIKVSLTGGAKGDCDDSAYIYLLVYTVEFLDDKFLDDDEEGVSGEMFDEGAVQITRPFRWFRVPKAALENLTIGAMFHQYADIPAGMDVRLIRSVIAEENISLATSFWTDDPQGVNQGVNAALLASPARTLPDVSVWCMVLLGRLDGVSRLIL
jgi:hypothetical protein